MFSILIRTTLVIFFASFVLSHSSNAEVARQSNELIFKQQDAVLNYHFESRDGSYVALGGAVSYAPTYNIQSGSPDPKRQAFPILMAIDKDGAIKLSRSFSLFPPDKLSESVTLRPVPGFDKPLMVNGGFVAALKLDAGIPQVGTKLTKQGLLGKFDEAMHLAESYRYEDNNDGRGVFLNSGILLSGEQAAFLVSKEEYDSKESFIAVFDEKLDVKSVIGVPAGCSGKLLFNPQDKTYIVISRYSRKSGNICFIPSGSGNTKIAAIDSSFQVEDAIFAKSGTLLVVGKQKRGHKADQKQHTLVLSFDKDLSFISGIEFPDILDCLGNALFEVPNGGYILSSLLRTHPIILQGNTVIMKLTDQLGIEWARIKEGSGGNDIRSIIFREDGSLNALLTLEMLSAPKREDGGVGNGMMRYDMVSKLDSFAVMEFEADGKERGNFTKPYEVRTIPLAVESVKIFGEPQLSTAPLASELSLKKVKVPLVETEITLEPKELKRPWN